MRVDEEELTRQGEGVDVFAVVAAGHVLLAEADGVLALCNAVKDLEFFL